MDAKSIGDGIGHAVTYVLSNPVAMLAAGIAAGNHRTLTYAGLLAVYKVQPLRALFFGDPATTKAKLAALVQEVDDDLDKIVAANAPPAAPTLTHAEAGKASAAIAAALDKAATEAEPPAVSAKADDWPADPKPADGNPTPGAKATP